MAKRPDRSVPGIVVVDKPSGLTSHDVVARMRKLAHTRKVGHAGTLDPMATGVLILGIGKATRLLTWITGHEKAYTATIRFGATTLSDDAQGELLETYGCVSLNEGELEFAMEELRGEIDQLPSRVSAKKIAGKRAYELVRAGADVALATQKITVHRLERVSPVRHTVLNGPDGPIDVVDLDIEVECSSGTYVRAIARDLGKAVGCGAHLTALRRTRVGLFTLKDAKPLADLEAQRKNQSDTQHDPQPAPGLIPLADAVRMLFPALVLDAAEAQRFAHGQAPARPVEEENLAGGSCNEQIIGAFNASGELLGLLRVHKGRSSTLTVFQGAEQ